MQLQEGEMSSTRELLFASKRATSRLVEMGGSLYLGKRTKTHSVITGS
jgi:hypothetical protein